MTHPFQSSTWQAPLLLLAVLAGLSGQAAAQAAVQAAQAVRGNLKGDHIVAVVNTEAVTSVEVAQRIERINADARLA